MSKQAMEAIRGRSVLDDSYRHQFFADPNRALAGYDLTKEERAALLSVDAETLDAFAGPVGGRRARRAAGRGARDRRPIRGVACLKSGSTHLTGGPQDWG